MTKLFRNIRKSLLNDGKTSKYLKYALGEIVLVVIGILIALQINNWNEHRKLQKEEIKILMGIKTDLKSTLIELETALNWNSESVNHIKKIKTFLKNDLSYDKELDNSFGILPHVYQPFITKTTYGSLQSLGINIIQNDSLKNNIIDMYDVVFPNILDYHKDEDLFKNQVILPYYSKHIEYEPEISVYTASPNNFDELKKDKSSVNIIGLTMRVRIRGVEKYNNSLELIRNLVKSIEDELKLRGYDKIL